MKKNDVSKTIYLGFIVIFCRIIFEIFLEDEIIIYLQSFINILSLFYTFYLIFDTANDALKKRIYITPPINANRYKKFKKYKNISLIGLIILLSIMYKYLYNCSFGNDILTIIT